MSKLGGVLKSAAHKLSEKNIGNKLGPPNVGARSYFVLQCWMQSNFQNFFTFCKIAVFIIKFGVGNFSDRSWLFVCSIRSNSCETLEGPQLDLGPVEAVKWPKTAMLKKIGLVTLLKISPNIWVTYETKQTPEPQDVYLSGVCFVSQVTHIFWEIFNNVTRVFKIIVEVQHPFSLIKCVSPRSNKKV